MKRMPVERLEARLADITTTNVDAIVNAANEALLPGDGVDGAIHDAAGPELFDACQQIPEVRPGVRCPTGEARITPGFNLPAQFVIHTVAPIWRGGGRREPELLAACYEAVFALAAEHQLRSIVIPPIGCGAFGYPMKDAARIAVRECRAALEAASSLELVLLVAIEDGDHRELVRALTQGID